MAQYVMVVTIGNSDSDVDVDINFVASEINRNLYQWAFQDPEGKYWPVTIRPLSEVIEC